MIDPSKPAQLFEEMGNKFNELLQSGPAKDFEKNARAMMAAGFSHLDLITREEFEVQKALLAAANEKIVLLEERLAALEGKDTAEP